jgi:hypothetical protein
VCGRKYHARHEQKKGAGHLSAWMVMHFCGWGDKVGASRISC